MTIASKSYIEHSYHTFVSEPTNPLPYSVRHQQIWSLTSSTIVRVSLRQWVDEISAYSRADLSETFRMLRPRGISIGFALENLSPEFGPSSFWSSETATEYSSSDGDAARSCWSVCRCNSTAKSSPAGWSSDWSSGQGSSRNKSFALTFSPFSWRIWQYLSSQFRNSASVTGFSPFSLNWKLW